MGNLSPRKLSKLSHLTKSSRRLDVIQEAIQSLQSTLAAAHTQQHGTFNVQAPVAAKQIPHSALGVNTMTPQTGPLTHSPFDSGLLKEHHGMAMTREPSPEDPGTNDTSGASVLVTEPMGTLYEVTRLRNIRSNQAKVSRTGMDSAGQVEDFISKGVCFDAISRWIC